MSLSSIIASRRPLAAMLGVAVAAALLVAPQPETYAAGDCPPGYIAGTDLPAPIDPLDRLDAHPALQGGFEADLDRHERKNACVLAKRPESFSEKAMMIGQEVSRTTAPFRSLAPGAFAAGIDEREELAAQPSDIEGSGGTWEPYGSGPLIFNLPEAGAVNGLGLVQAMGRIDDLVYDAENQRIFAALGTGGIWMSEDLAQTWVSIGDNLPSQITGSIGYSPAGGADGTLVAVSGDPTFGGLQFTGFGAFRSTDLGETWTKVAGIPEEALGFKVKVDPTDPNRIYAATGKGLYVSDDAGQTFVNANLPTGEGTDPEAGEPDCTGKTVEDDPACLLANMVTDIVIKTPGGTTEEEGGQVIAAVGWRGGQFENPDGTIQSPNNGLYFSETGDAGTFEKLEAPGFTGQEQIGRIELGPTTGPEQDHNYLYAIVQDAVRFNGGLVVLDQPIGVEDPENTLTAGGTALNGVYVSSDFGQSWTQMASADTISNNPQSGSTFSLAIRGLGLAPGIQSWYDLWIQPDPTRQSGGVPTRLFFGMEEIWQNEDADLGRPQDGRTEFKVIGRYFSDERCQVILEGAPVCPDRRPITDTDSTTTHPDHHDAVLIPDGNGGVTLVAGHDGGISVQGQGVEDEFDNSDWGDGNNIGFNTLLPYNLAVAADGTVWYGLQDNGTAKTDPETGVRGVFLGGDGTFVAVDPDNSDIAYGAFPGNSIQVTVTGGRGEYSPDASNPDAQSPWRGISPGVSNAKFVNPFEMDPTDANHLVTAGREVVETTFGPETDSGRRLPDEECESDPGFAPSETCWVQVFDLGTAAADEEEEGADQPETAENGMSAIDVLGDSIYVGFCGVCDILNADQPFRNGIATNIGGDEPPQRLTDDGWHFAAAEGLPNRYINSIAIDEEDPETIYVAVGGYSRRWVPPGSLQDDNMNIGEGHVFKSTDAGESFTDISANLPDIPATWIDTRGGQLILGTDAGMYISDDLDGSEWAVLGDGLPVAPIKSFETQPGNDDLLFVATYGRGVYTYDFAQAAPGDPEVPGDPGGPGDPGTPGDPGDPDPGEAEARRVGGADRIETAALVSAEHFDDASTVVLARSDEYADALAGAPLARSLDAPILLTQTEGLASTTATEIGRLGANRVVLLGGTAALSEQVEADLRAAGVETVDRVGGTNRFDTARLIAGELGGDTVYVAEGADPRPERGWPDALSVAPLAAHQGRPILLVETDRLPAETTAAIEELSASTGTVIGGTAAVSTAVEDQLAGDLAVERVGGATRYDTSAMVAELAVDAGLSAARPWLAQGGNWPDALTSGPTVAADGGVLLLVHPEDLDQSPETRDFLAANSADAELVRVLGGTAAVSARVFDQVEALLGL